MVPRIVRRRICPVVVQCVRQRHVARTERIHLAQRGKRIVDLVAALDANERSNPAGFVNVDDVVCRIGHLQIVRVASDHCTHKIDLLQRHLYCRRASDLVPVNR